MKMTKYGLIAMLSVLSFVLLAGCEGRGGSDAAHPVFIRAEQCRTAGDYAAAAAQYKRFLRQRPESAVGHLSLASVYDENLDEPALAIYHYREYLRIEPESPDAEVIAAWLRNAEMKYRDRLNSLDFPEQPADPAASDELNRMRRQNANLKRLLLAKQREIDTLRQSGDREVAPPPTGRVMAPAEAGAAPEHRSEAAVHVVEPGDTLGKIARKYYGSSDRYRPIMEANNLSSSSILRVGQQLIVPPLAKPDGEAGGKP